MKSEQEIKEQLRKMIEQIDSTKETNIAASKRLVERSTALAWVLGYRKAPENLTFTREELATLEAFY